MSCIFCRIVSKEAPGTFIYEDEDIAVIVPKEQVNDGHILAIPKAHYTDVFAIEDTILRDLISVTKKVSEKTIAQTEYTAVNLLHASGIDAQQSVAHFHLHIVPRKPADGLDLWIRQGL